MNCPVVTLNNGVKIPQLGLGVYQCDIGQQTQNAVEWALECGYRHIDTATAYGNEESVGLGIQASGIAREELFITTKVANEDVRSGNTEQAFYNSIKLLNTEYLDLYLIHWPVEGFEAAWKVMENLYHKGLIRAIGVCNFHQHHLETLAQTAEVIPCVDQVECHPLMTQKSLTNFCAQHQIAIEAWSPLGGTGGNLLQNPVLQSLAQKYNRTPAQIVLRWDIQNHTIVIPKSTHRERIISNYNVFDFSLDRADMDSIDNLNRNRRVGPDPDNFDF